MAKSIVIFASGNGSNAQNIIQYFQNSQSANVVMVLSNNEKAMVLERAKKLKVTAVTFTKDELYSNDKILNMLKEINPTLIVLAGFMLKFPDNILHHFPNKVINIHPALLPKYGGKGMYGKRVHESILNNKETETGISIHYVNENYDEGKVIFQKKIALTANESVKELEEKVHRLEHEWFPKIIDQLLQSQS